MKTVRRLLYRDIVAAVAFVALAFLSLFLFIDLVGELDDIGERGYGVGQAMLAALLDAPGNLYELFPIAVLIGTIYSMSRMAQSSEFTILRTGGLGPGRALGLLAALGIAFGVVTFVVGDYAAPLSERESALIKARYKGLRIGAAGAWLKDRRTTPEGELNASVNVQGLGADGMLQGIRIFEFDADGRLLRRISAPAGRVHNDASWSLRDARITHWPADLSQAPGGARVVEESRPEYRWTGSLQPGVVAAALLPASTMSTVDLWRYAQHLSGQEQAAQRHAIQFWKKALYPLACLVMVALALPFAYLHARAGGVSLKVFGGILLGISFVLLNNLAGHLGLLRHWTPWVVAAAPSLVYMVLSMAAFAWLVRYR
jgi:lipopolysaccharide export system permease protein